MQFVDLRPGLLLPLILIVLALGYLVWIPVYNVFLHPLRNYPGPKLWAATRIPHFCMILSGDSHKKILELHREYGGVVRVAPDELSYIDRRAWVDMLGHRKHGQGENGQDPVFWATQKHSVISADRENHGRMRRIISHGFSAQSMLEQQPIIQGYVDLLIQRLRELCKDGTQPLEMTSWYNWATFDIIGDLAFGEPFGCLKNADYHPWVSMIFGRVRGNAINTALRRFPFGTTLTKVFMPANVRRQFEAYYQITVEKVGRRLAMKHPRHDFMEALSKAEGKAKLSYPEILDNASLLIVAGSETTATTLSGVTYLLATHPQVLTKLEDEVRSTFASENEIDLLSVQKMGYMFAVLNESLRIYPPVPTAFPKKAQAGGDTICGQYVPENTILGIWQWPLYHSPQNFTLPDSFIPERWLGDPRFAGDHQDTAFHPFLTGPRSCIGKNLAYAEMRLILAKVIWNFDLHLHPSSKNWLQENKAYVLWDKPVLNVYLKPRRLDTNRHTSADAVPVVPIRSSSTQPCCPVES